MRIFYKENSQQLYKRNRWLDYHLFHKLRRRLQPLHFINRDKNFNPMLSPEQKSLGFFISFTKSNRPYFPTSKNKQFIKNLERIGFFDVFSTNNSADDINKGFGVYLSQVILFLQYGIDWVRKGFKMPAYKMEIHHLSANVLDNRLSNLEVVTVNLHAFLTNLQIGQHHCYSSEPQYTKFYNDIPTNNGDWLKTFKSSKSRLIQLIHLTLKKTKALLKQNLFTFAIKNNQVNKTSLGLSNLSTNLINKLLSNNFAFSSLNNSEEKEILTLSWNWLFNRTLPDIKTIYKNLKGAASTFLKYAFTRNKSSEVFKALIA